MTPKKVKPQLHQSGLNMLMRCGELFRRVYIEGEREAPGFTALVGRGLHEMAQQILQYKLDNGGRLMVADSVRELAHDQFLRIWQSSPVLLTKEERQMKLEVVKASGVDKTMQLSVLYLETFAKSIQPRVGGIERKWVVVCNGYPYDLAGQIDVDEITGDIRDLKGGQASCSQRIVDTSEQFTLYCLAKFIIDKKIPDRVWLDGVFLSPAGDPRVASYHSSRTREDFVSAKFRFERACEIIERGAFTPASRSQWWCSEKFCGFAADGSCKFYAKNPTCISMSTTKPKGASRERTRTGQAVIKAHTDRWYDAIR